MGCRYCENVFSIPSGSEGGLPDRILFESEHFVAVPTVGSLVEGWLLIITRAHYLCMGALPVGMFVDLDRFKFLVVQAVESNYGPVAIFEHGPSRPKEAVGCGVDHAHLHVVPTNCDLLQGLHGVTTAKIRWTEVSGVWDAREPHLLGLDYLYVEQPFGHGRIATSRGFGSQLFRQVIASHIGEPENFDWKLDSGTANVRRTVERFAPWACRNAASLAGTLADSR